MAQGGRAPAPWGTLPRRGSARPGGDGLRAAALCVAWLAAAAPLGAAEPDFGRAAAEALELLQSLVRIDTSNPPGNELPAARLLEKFLGDAGLACEVIESAPGRGMVLCRLKGEGSAKPILVMAHLDVVGVDASRWKVPPFSGALRDGYIYGRGVLDDKGMAAATAEALALLARSRQPLARDLLFLGTADEESSGGAGVEWLLERRPDLLQIEAALNEGGRLLQVEDRVLVAAVQNDEKRYLDVKVVAGGASGHSSLPGADNPIVHLARALDRLASHRFPPAATSPVRAYFEALAPVQDAPTAHCMTHLDDPSEGGLCADILSRNPVWNALLRTTCTPTIVNAGFRANVIPSEAQANLNCRLLPGTDPAKHLADLRKAVGELPVKLDAGSDWGGRPAASPMEGALPEAIRRAVQKLAPGAAAVAYTSPGGTDSRHFRQKGVPAYGLLPFPIREEEARTMHGDNERLRQESFAFGVRLMHEILRQAASPECGSIAPPGDGRLSEPSGVNRQDFPEKRRPGFSGPGIGDNR